MLRTMMKSKIHRATVTQADLHYVGSVTVDEDLLDAADLLAGELVHIVDVTNGARLETYTIAGERGSGVIGINGAAAPSFLIWIISGLYLLPMVWFLLSTMGGYGGHETKPWLVPAVAAFTVSYGILMLLLWPYEKVSPGSTS